MSYDMEAHRALVRTNLLQLLRGGVAWHDYVREEAKHYEKEDPTLHRGLLQAVQEEIAAALRKAGARITNESNSAPPRRTTTRRP